LGDEESSDLLIFKLRDGKELEESTEGSEPISAGSAVEGVAGEDESSPNPNVVASAKGLKCSIHPWRAAYAVCSKCGLPFCYVDIIKKNGKYYCLDDISTVEAEEVHKNVSKNNFFTGVGGIFLLFNGFYLIYIFYPQALVLYHSTLTSLTVKGMMNLIADYYYPSIANLVAIIASLAAGLAAAAWGRRRLGIVIGFLISMLVSYEFMNSSGVNFLILPIIISFFSMILMVLGNMSAVREVNELVDEEYKHVDWPRPEVF